MFPVSHLAGDRPKEPEASTEKNVSPNDADSEHGDEFYEDPKAARQLLTKCDIRLIPILGTLYLVSFLDRSNIANARLFGLEKSLHMPSNGFNTCLWIFYLPFVVVEIPSNLFMSLNKVKPNQWLAGAMLILGMFQLTYAIAMRMLTLARGCIYVPGTHSKLRWFACLQIHYGHHGSWVTARYGSNFRLPV